MAHGNEKHGYFGTKTYYSWSAMKMRCTNPKNPGYKNYGGRGITYCPTWEQFENFLADMGEMPNGMSLEREDNDGPYCKSNCKWASRAEQNLNRRSVQMHTLGGKTQCTQHWATELNIAPPTLRRWLKSGKTLQEIAGYI